MHIGARFERLWTHWTCVQCFASVHSHVFTQGYRLLEHLLTYGALVCCVTKVHVAFVAAQGTAVRWYLSAQVTLVLCIAMPTKVASEAVFVFQPEMVHSLKMLPLSQFDLTHTIDCKCDTVSVVVLCLNAADRVVQKAICSWMPSHKFHKCIHWYFHVRHECVSAVSSYWQSCEHKFCETNGNNSADKSYVLPHSSHTNFFSPSVMCRSRACWSSWNFFA